LDNISYEQQVIDHFEFDYKNESYSVDFVNGEYVDWYGQRANLATEEIKAIETELSKHF